MREPGVIGSDVVVVSRSARILQCAGLEEPLRAPVGVEQGLDLVAQGRSSPRRRVRGTPCARRRCCSSAACSSSSICRQRSGVTGCRAAPSRGRARAGGAPFALDGRRRNADDLGGLLDGQAAEVLELDDVRLACIEGRQRLQCLVEGEQVGGALRAEPLAASSRGTLRRGRLAWRCGAAAPARRGCDASPARQSRGSVRGRSGRRAGSRPAAGTPR